MANAPNPNNYRDELQLRKRRIFLELAGVVAVLLLLSVSILTFLALRDKQEKSRLFSKKESPNIIQSPVPIPDYTEDIELLYEAPVDLAQPEKPIQKSPQGRPPVVQKKRSKPPSHPIPAKKHPIQRIAKKPPPPLEQKVIISEDVEAAIQAQEPLKELESASFEKSSAHFKKGMMAFKQRDYSGAIRILSQVPKTATKQRGVKEREEYVKANYYRGLSLQKTGRLKEAVKAYKIVLSVEKYFPVCYMNLGICYVGLQQYKKARNTLQHVIRYQNRVPPAQYDDVMQRTRYFRSIAWTKMYQTADESDEKEYFRKQANLKWVDYLAWYGKNNKYKKANLRAENYIKSLSARQ